MAWETYPALRASRFFGQADHETDVLVVQGNFLSLADGDGDANIKFRECKCLSDSLVRSFRVLDFLSNDNVIITGRLAASPAALFPKN